MAEYIVQGESLTAIADKVRVLAGTSDKLSLDAMASNVENANTEVDEQADLIEQLITAIDELPESGVDLPTLTNEGSASDLLSSKQLIDQEGNIVTGTFTIDEELTAQDNLISQIQAALEGKAAGGSGVEPIETCTVTVESRSPDKPTFYYTDASDFTFKTLNMMSGEFEVPKNTIVVITPWSTMNLYSGCVELFYAQGYVAFQINNDTTFTIEM